MLQSSLKKYFIFDTDTAFEVAVKATTPERHMVVKCVGMELPVFAYMQGFIPWSFFVPPEVTPTPAPPGAQALGGIRARAGGRLRRGVPSDRGLVWGGE